MTKKLLTFSWIAVSLFLLLYSFTQIDLNLTFTKISWLHAIEMGFKYIGYFQRPLSAGIYVVLMSALFMLYFITLKKIKESQLSRTDVRNIIIAVSIILFFSYNAFSYDFFNYMFDAKIVTSYHLNPYEHAPFEFQTDPMLHFMHSVERKYPYGPVWLLVSIPFSFIGGNIFLFAYYLFKLLLVGSFLLMIYFLEKIAESIDKKNSLLTIAFFALNPLILIEVLVSAHNDMVMALFAVVALFFLLRKQYFLSIVILLVSIGIKFATVLLLPLFLIFIFYKKIKLENFLLLLVVVMLIAVVFMSGPTAAKGAEPQPWYLINLLPFVALFAQKKNAIVVTSIISIVLLLFYVPFLYMGSWPVQIVNIKYGLIAIGLIVSGIILLKDKYSALR